MEAIEFANPFGTLAELLRILRLDILVELGAGGPECRSVALGPRMEPVMGSIAAMITEARHLWQMIEDLREKEPESWAVFQRAIARVHPEIEVGEHGEAA